MNERTHRWKGDMEQVLTEVFRKVGLPDKSAVVAGAITARAIHQHGDEDIQPVDMSAYSISIEEMDGVDDVQGMTDALGTLATALINVEDALA